MILIGQFDSPFVRRVGIALTLYGLAFEHQPWSVFRDADSIRRYNPLVRVPTLVLDGGEALLESSAILDHLDGLAGAGKALLPAAGMERARALRIVSLATGLADKAVSLFYERRLHAAVSDVWVDRCRAQIAATLGVLEGERAAVRAPFWRGERFGHEDIAVACAVAFALEAHPKDVTLAPYPALAAHCARLEAMPAFVAIRQPFIPPA